MSIEVRAFVKGLILGTGVIGAGGILIGTSFVPGLLLLLIAIVANVTVNHIWSDNE